MCKLITRGEEGGGRTRGGGLGGWTPLRMCGRAIIEEVAPLDESSTMRDQELLPAPISPADPRRTVCVCVCARATRFTPKFLSFFSLFMPFDRDRYRIGPSRSRICKLINGDSITISNFGLQLSHYQLPNFHSIVVHEKIVAKEELPRHVCS